jgi:hypothetical protein
MLRHSIPTNHSLWAAFAIALFVAASCVNWVPEGRTPPYWVVWWIFLTGNYSYAPDMVAALVILGLGLAVPAIVLGWVVHAMVLVVCVAWRGQPDVVEKGARQLR